MLSKVLNAPLWKVILLKIVNGQKLSTIFTKTLHHRRLKEFRITLASGNLLHRGKIYFFSKYDQIRGKLRIWSHLLQKSLVENFIFYVVLIIDLHKSLLSILAKVLDNICKQTQDQTCTICHWTTWNSLQKIHKKFFIIFWTFLHFNIPWCSWTAIVCYSNACFKRLCFTNFIWVISSQPYWPSSSWKIRKFLH